MRRRRNPYSALIEMTRRDVAMTCPVLRHMAGLPPLPPTPEPVLSAEVQRLADFFAPKPETTKERDHE